MDPERQALEWVEGIIVCKEQHFKIKIINFKFQIKSNFVSAVSFYLTLDFIDQKGQH